MSFNQCTFIYIVRYIFLTNSISIKINAMYIICGLLLVNNS